MGNMAGPHTGWLLMRSMETLKIRMEKQAANAQEVANFLEYTSESGEGLLFRKPKTRRWTTVRNL